MGASGWERNGPSGTVRDREKPGILLLPSYDLRVSSPNFHMWGGWELGGHLSLVHTTI